MVRSIKASSELPPELVAAWRIKGMEPDSSSPYKTTLFCSHALSCQNLNRFARREGLREGEMDIIADETMWRRKLFPIRLRPVKSPHEFRSREFPHAIPFTPSEVAWFLKYGPCAEMAIDVRSTDLNSSFASDVTDASDSSFVSATSTPSQARKKGSKKRSPRRIREKGEEDGGKREVGGV